MISGAGNAAFYLAGILCGFLVLFLIFSFVASKMAHAQVPTEDLFLVPYVKSVNGNPQVYPTPSSNYSDPYLEKGPYTPANYVAPQYDAFNAQNKPAVKLPEDAPNIAPSAQFIISNNNNYLGDLTSGTTKTKFTFDANGSYDLNGKDGALQARWDFENDGVIDSYFSRIRRVSHVYDKAGIYTVRLEVLDEEGNVSKAYAKVTVVDNTPPKAVLAAKTNKGVIDDVLNFDTSLSSDDQYRKSSLSFRFDWNSDGKWDTPLQNKTAWNHLYTEAGNYKVTMQAVDPEGATANTTMNVTIEADAKPTANLVVSKLPDNANGSVFAFDASASNDDHSKAGKLMYRWDFNYSGKNDIVFDTSFSTSPKYTGYYNVPGEKVVRLEIRDENGHTDEAFAKIEA